MTEISRIHETQQVLSQAQGKSVEGQKPVSFLRTGAHRADLAKTDKSSLKERVDRLQQSPSPGYVEWVKTRPCGNAVGAWGDTENQWRDR
jgi:hypothetical protein